MKNWIVYCLLLPVALFGRSLEKLSPPDFETYEKISLQELSKIVHEGVAPRKFQNILIECPAGTEIPFKFSLRGDVFSFEPSSDVKFSIKVLKTCYMTHLPSLGLVFSTDLKNWRKANEFFVGKFAAAFMMENQIPTSCFELELHEKTNRVEIPIGDSFSPNTKIRYSHRYNSQPFPHHVWEPTEEEQE